MAISELLAAGLLLTVVLMSSPSNAFLTDDDKEELLRAHNFYRGKVSPLATNMAKLVWDDELALLAQFWSVMCEMMPNENRHEQSTEFDYVGQINAASLNLTINLTSMVFDWYFDGRTYDYSQAACIDDEGEAAEEGCERYIQLVWATTTNVGCGGYFCEEIMGWDEGDDQDDNQNAFFVTCLYGPGGGIVGEHPYSTGGQTCSACPDTLPFCEDNLCASGAVSMVKVSMATLMLTMAVLSFLL